MATDTNEIKLTEEMTVDDVLDAAGDAPIAVERDGVTYTVRRERDDADDDIWKDYDPQAVIEMLEILKTNPMDIDGVKKDHARMITRRWRICWTPIGRSRRFSTILSC